MGPEIRVAGWIEAGPWLACLVGSGIMGEMQPLSELWTKAVMGKYPASPFLPLSDLLLVYHVRNPAGSQQQRELARKSTGASGQWPEIEGRAEQSRGR